MVTNKQVREWFPDSDVVIVPAGVLPGRVTDDAARRVLTEAGLPEGVFGVLDLDANLAGRMRVLGEMYAERSNQPPAGSADLVLLGFAGRQYLALDGATGEVLQADEGFGVRPFAPSLETFLAALAAVTEQVNKYLWKPHELSADDLVARAAKELPRGDHAAEPAWRSFVGDVLESVKD